ncbi:MAG: recombinase family protein, partial [Anaerolineae bacterium]|nr:recombinase family protein [Anaerolineae bacterium]
MKRAIVYARVSTDDQRGNYSIPTQVEACHKYAKQQGYSVIGDQYVSAETGRDVAVPGEGTVRAYVDDFSSREVSRPSLNAAFQYLETTGYDVVIVYAVDRLARDPYIRQTLEKDFAKLEAVVEYATGGYDDTPGGDVKKDLDATFAKWENAVRVERCNRGRLRKAESGFFVGSRAPYGYEMDMKAFGGLAVNEEQASVVRKIFSLYAEDGLSISGIQRWLMDHNVPTWSGKLTWSKSSVARILGNRAYVGQCYFNKRKRDGKRLELNPRTEWVEIPVTPIVEQWMFDEAQGRLEENKRTSRRQPRRFYLLSGVVFCQECERPYVSQTDLTGRDRSEDGAQYYRHRRKIGHCSNRYVSAKKLEPLVWDVVSQLLL